MATRRVAVSRETPTAEAGETNNTTIVTEREAREATERMRAKLKDGDFWELGALAKRARDEQWAKLLGMKGLGEWMEYLGNSQEKCVSTIKRALRIAIVFPSPTQEMRDKLKEGNAYALTELRLPPEVRTGEEWIRKAIDLSIKDFKSACNKAMGKEDEEWYQPWARLPLTTEPVYDALIKKLALEVFEVDVEAEPKKLVMITEMVIVMLHQTPVEALREALIGDDGSAPPDIPE